MRDADVEDFSCGDVARHEVSVGGVPLLQKVVAFRRRDGQRVAAILRLAGHPNAPAFAAGAFAHQSQLVRAGYGCGVDLNELAVGVLGARSVHPTGRTAGADERHGATPEDEPTPAGGEHDGVGAKGAHLHAEHVLSDHATAVAVAIEHRAEEFPVFQFVDQSLSLPPADLLVQSV